MLNVMLDLETMGSRKDAAIVAIGAVAFSRDGIEDEFYTPVDLESSMSVGGTVSAGTISWWVRQGDAARSGVSEPGEAEGITSALSEFAAWYRRVGGGPVWGCGAAFDNVVISSAFRATGVKCPWGYREDRCYRTLRELAKQIPFERVGVAHNALDDARSQAIHLSKILTALGLWG